MDYQTILFDFDGVLCKGRLYDKTLLPNYREVYNWIQSNIFDDKELVRKWMRNQINSAGINKLIAKNTDIGYEKLNRLYEESVRTMKTEEDLLELARTLKSSGKKIGIVTDNMDVFTKIIVPTCRLDTQFDVIINSADYGVLKKEENGRLFDIALTTLGVNIENSLMIDDSESKIEVYKQKGGHGFVYQDTAELKSFLQT